MVKLVYCVRRKVGMSREEFQARWLDVHGPLARSLRKQLPMMKRYVQSHTIAQETNDALRSSRGTGEEYDGITEMWLESLDDLGSDLRPAGSRPAAKTGRRRIRLHRLPRPEHHHHRGEGNLRLSRGSPGLRCAAEVRRDAERERCNLGRSQASSSPAQ